VFTNGVILTIAPGHNIISALRGVGAKFEGNNKSPPLSRPRRDDSTNTTIPHRHKSTSTSIRRTTMTFTELPESGSGSHMGAAPLLPSTLFASESKNEETETASEFSLVGVIVLVVLLLLLSAILVILFYRILQRHGRIRDERQHTAPAPSSSSAVIDPKRIKRRYETIEGWLITKKVQPHTVVCGKIKSLLSKEKDEENPFKEVTSQDTAETDTDDEYWSSEEDGFFGAGQEEEGKECPVCMDPLKVGDVVSWSPSQNCEHAFHHECIKEWLLQHTDWYVFASESAYLSQYRS